MCDQHRNIVQKIKERFQNLKKEFEEDGVRSDILFVKKYKLDSLEELNNLQECRVVARLTRTLSHPNPTTEEHVIDHLEEILKACGQ